MVASSGTLGALPALAGKIPLDPNIDLGAAFKQIEADRTAQQGAVQQFGTTQDTNLQNIYNQLQQGLGTSAKAQTQAYDTGASNISNTYGAAQNNQSAASAQMQGGMREMAQRMGLDPAAYASAAGDMGKQAATLENRLTASKADRVTSMQELGGKMTAVMQLGIQAAQQAEAQGRKDLSAKITTELQRVQTAAQRAQTDFTGVKSQQLYKQTLQAQTQFAQAQRQMASEQRAAASAEAAANRAAGAASRSQASQSNSDRNFQLALAKYQDSKGKPTTMDNFVAQQQYMQQNPKMNSGQQSYDAIYQRAQGDFGASGRSALDMLLAGMPPKDVWANTPGVKNNKPDILSVYSRLKNTNRSG